MKFQFQMQKILDLQEKKREQEEWNYAKLAKQLDDENIKLKSFVDHRVKIQSEILNGQAEGITIKDISQSQTYVSYLSQQIHIQQENINNVKQSIRIKQKEIIELKTEEMKWVKLKEKKWQEFQYESNQQEQKELDEIANSITYR